MPPPGKPSLRSTPHPCAIRRRHMDALKALSKRIASLLHRYAGRAVTPFDRLFRDGATSVPLQPLARGQEEAALL